MASDTAAPATPQLSFLEKADLVPGLLQVVFAAVYAAITGPFRGDSGAKKYKVHVNHAAFRKLETRLSIAQTQYIMPSTETTYNVWCKSKKIDPVTDVLPNGTKAHWLGSKDAKNVLIYYHGGGFCMPMNEAYPIFMTNVIEHTKATGKDFAIVILSYTLAPHAVYPTQLDQAVELLRYIINVTKRAPSNVIIGGDSAGGNLTLGVLSHLSHPHPKIKALELSEPLLGAILISPWVSFDTNWPAVKENVDRDVVAPPVAKVWSGAMLSGAPTDNYNEAINAPTDWWKGLKAKDILIVGGTDEILIDSIKEIAQRIETAHPNTQTVIGVRETHIQPLVGPAVGDNDPTEQGEAIKSWVAARL